MSYAFEITKMTGERRLIQANSLREIKRLKNNYRRSPHFKGALLSKIFSTIDHNRFTLGDLGKFRVKP